MPFFGSSTGCIHNVVNVTLRSLRVWGLTCFIVREVSTDFSTGKGVLEGPHMVGMGFPSLVCSLKTWNRPAPSGPLPPDQPPQGRAEQLAGVGSWQPVQVRGVYHRPLPSTH